MLSSLRDRVHLARWYHYPAGLLGVCFVGGGIVLSPLIGVGGFLSCGILGQLAFSMMLDTLGVYG